MDITLKATYSQKVYCVLLMKFNVVSIVLALICGDFRHMEVKLLFSIYRLFFLLKLCKSKDIVPDFVTIGKSMGNGHPGIYLN